MLPQMKSEKGKGEEVGKGWDRDIVGVGGENCCSRRTFALIPKGLSVLEVKRECLYWGNND